MINDYCAVFKGEWEASPATRAPELKEYSGWKLMEQHRLLEDKY